MKRFILLIASVVMFSFGAFANVTDKQLDHFSKVVVNTEARVRLVEGDEYSVLVRSKDGYSAKYIHLDVENDTLSITNSDSNACNKDCDNLHIIIVAPRRLNIEAGSQYDLYLLANTEEKEAV